MNEQKELAAVLARRLAQREVSDANVEEVAQRLVSIGELPTRLDICVHGLCGDYYVDRKNFAKLFERLHDAWDVRRLEVFTKGIFPPDKFHVRFEMGLDR